jgi:hypothetical protein
MHMALVCYVSLSRIGILTRTENGPGTGLSRGNEFYVIKAFETWSLVNQSQEYSPAYLFFTQKLIIYICQKIIYKPSYNNNSVFAFTFTKCCNSTAKFK